MRGTPTHRTVLVWICVLSLTFAGCAANRTEAPMNGSGRGIIHSLAVIPAGGVPEMNVVRMGNSRIVGALQGAGRGFMKGVSAIAEGAGGMGGCSGDGCVFVAAVLIALMVSAGTVGAMIGGVKGSLVAAPYEQVSDPDDATRKRLASLRIQEGIAGLVEEEAGRRLAIPVSPKEPPPEPSDHREETLRRLKEAEIDATIRVGITRVGFEGPVGKNPPVSVAITLHAEIIRVANGEKIFEKTIEYRSDAMPAGHWVDNDFLALQRELDAGARDLAKRCVDEILDADLVPVPVRG